MELSLDLLASPSLLERGESGDDAPNQKTARIASPPEAVDQDGQPGADAYDELGLGDEMRAIFPPESAIPAFPSHDSGRSWGSVAPGVSVGSVALNRGSNDAVVLDRDHSCVWLDVMQCVDGLWWMSVVMQWCGGRLGLMFSKLLQMAPLTKA